MKKAMLLLFILSGCFYYSYSQIQCKNAYKYSIGDVVTFNNCDTDNYKPGDSGANQTWDLRNIHKVSETTMRIKKVADVANGTEFPSADYAEYYNDGHSNFIRNANNNIFYVGATDGGGSATAYTEGFIAMFNPLEYGQTIIDSYYTKSTASSTVAFSGKGVAKITGDGYGKLMLPDKTYTDVLRVRLNLTELDTVQIGSSVATANYTTSYIWFDTLKPYELCRMDSTFIHADDQDYIIKSVYYFKEMFPTSIPAPLENTENKLKCSIDNDRIYIHSVLDKNTNYQICLYNVTGNLLLRESFTAQENGNIISLNHSISHGVYFVMLNNQNTPSLAITKVTY